MPPVVLVADDDPDDVLLLSRAFLTAGLPHRVMHVRDGQEALSYLAGEPNYVDRFKYPLPRLLMLDVSTNRQDGLNLLDWLQHRPDFGEMPVIVISSSEKPEDRLRLEALGVDEYRLKPAGLPGWVTVVKDLANRWLSTYPEARRRERIPSKVPNVASLTEHIPAAIEPTLKQ